MLSGKQFTVGNIERLYLKVNRLKVNRSTIGAYVGLCIPAMPVGPVSTIYNDQELKNLFFRLKF